MSEHEPWACRIYPLLYQTNDMACRDRITIGLLGIDTADNVRHARIADTDFLKAFCQCDDEEAGYMNEYVDRFTSWEEITYEKMASTHERSWYPSTYFIGEPVVSIRPLDEVWEIYRPMMLRF